MRLHNPFDLFTFDKYVRGKAFTTFSAFWSQISVNVKKKALGMQI